MIKELLFAVGGVILGAGVMFLVQSTQEPKMSQQYQKIGEQSMHDRMMKGEHGMRLDMDMMVGSLLGKTGAEFDQIFLSEMIIHHEGAVQMAELALKNAEHQELKELANNIITAQNKEIQQMKDWQKLWVK